MQFSLYAVFEAVFLITISILWCELGYYHFIFHYNCRGWSEPNFIKGQSEFTRMLVIADTHIMGRIKSVGIDKWRREWQMEQAFSISRSIFKPDMIIFLGDIFDEASFAHDVAFEKACQDFERIFPIDEQDRIIIAGNHDVGYHNQMINYPYVMQRFQYKYQAASSIELVRKPKLKGINMIVANSMSFYNDTCPYCSQSIAATNRIAYDLDKYKNTTEFSEPILLSHIPLYRPDDTLCDYPSSIKERVKNKNIEGEDVIHMVSSQFLLQRLSPKLILSGHTHMKCTTSHKIYNLNHKTFKELTITSFNHKYAERTPGFLLLSANATHVFTEQCDLVEEWVIILIYVLTILTILSRLIMLCKDKPGKKINILDRQTLVKEQ